MTEEERWIRDCYVPPTPCVCGLQLHCTGYPCTPERIEHFQHLHRLERWIGVISAASLDEEDRKDRQEEAKGEFR